MVSAPFDPAAVFLISEGNSHESLFEHSHSRSEVLFRCKGCGVIVNRWERLKHYKAHRAELERSEEARKARLKVERAANLKRAREARKEAQAA